jgi:hypothetical protein
MGFKDRLTHAWDAFTQNEQQDRIQTNTSFGVSYGSRPDRVRFRGADRSIISSIYNRIGIDAAAIEIVHVRTDADGQYTETMKTGLNTCLTVEANIDQAARAFRQDIFMTLFEKGVAAVVPVETTLDPTVSQAYDIRSLRVGEVVAWFPGHVRVLLYNEKSGKKEEITLKKDYVAIVENPLYSVMNEPNSTLQRLIRKLSLLDSVDEQASSGKLDMIIQLPYVIKSEARREQAESRRKDIENNMLNQVQFLTNMLYGQLGLTEDVFNGTASEAVMLNYYNRTIEPLLAAVAEEMQRTFLTKTARSQFQAIKFYRDPFTLAPIGVIAELADKLTRNEIVTSNEIRSKLGMKPSSDPKANQLVNSNMPQPNPAPAPADAVPPTDPNAVDPGASPSIAETPLSMLSG